MKKWFGVLAVLFVASVSFAGEEKLLKKIQMDGEKQSSTQKAVRTLYDEGFTMVGEDDSLKIGAWMQTDARVFPNSHPGLTRLLVRRARIDLKGNLEKIFSVQVMGEFEGDGETNAANLKQGFLEYNQFPAFRIRVGQFKEPYGLENLYADLWLDFLERPVGENFIRPEQDLGVMFFGKLFGKSLEYGFGIFNGSGTNIAETNDDKDFAARLALTPFASLSAKGLRQLTFGGSFTWGRQTSTLDSTGPTTAAGTRFLTFVSPTTGVDVRTDHTRTRAGGDLEWLIGPFSLKGEYSYSRFEGIVFRNVTRAWILHGISLQTTCLLTGEEKKQQGSVIPKANFNPKEGNWGAWELAFRAETFHSDQGLINAGFATGTDDLFSVTGGINWYLNRHIRVMANYFYAGFDDLIANANANSEHVGLLRFQFNI